MKRSVCWAIAGLAVLALPASLGAASFAERPSLPQLLEAKLLWSDEAAQAPEIVGVALELLDPDGSRYVVEVSFALPGQGSSETSQFHGNPPGGKGNPGGPNPNGGNPGGGNPPGGNPGHP